MEPLLLKHLPNALTLLRLLLAPVVAGLLLAGAIELVVVRLDGGERRDSQLLFAASALFLVAALTDLFDGMAARAFKAESKFGRVIDPIADKALVGLPLIAYALLAVILIGLNPLSFVVAGCVAVIVIRDVMMTVIRLRSPDREGPRVSSLAKIKTAIEMVVVGYWLALYCIEAGVQRLLNPPGELLSGEVLGLVWLGLLVLATALSAWTAWGYLSSSKPRP